MSRPKKIEKNQNLESAVKADSVTTEEVKEGGKEKGHPAKPIDRMLEEAQKHNPLDKICADVRDADFEGEVQFTEEDLNALTPDANGRNIFEFYQLDEPEEEFEDWIYLELPILNNELAKQHNVFVMVVVPYLFKIPLSDINTDPRVNDDTLCIILGDTFLAVTEETLNEYSKALNYIGLEYGAQNISENENALEKIREIVEAAQVRETGYYEDLMEYWYAGRLYHEKDVIWVELETMAKIPLKKNPQAGIVEEIEEEPEPVDEVRTLGSPPTFVLNFDVLGGPHTAIDISRAKNVKIENGRRVLSKTEEGYAKFYGQNLDFLQTPTPAEEVWHLATEKAKQEDAAGFAVVCLGGKFYVPVETSINFYTHEVEEYISLFNVVPCFMNHHNCIGWIIVDVGNMQINTGVRYLKGRHFDWKKRIEQELKSYRLDNPDFDPFADPYDDPTNSYDF